MEDKEYEPQPQAPDLASVVQEDTAESLVGPPGEDVLDSGYSPPDRPLVIDERPTASELARPETLDERVERERADTDPEAVDPDSADPWGHDTRAGRLEADPGANTNATEALDRGVDGGAASAEEAAVHEKD